jgi:nicotinamidase-related amidase
VLGLVEAGARVQVVTDAIRGVADETTEQTFAEMRAAGIEFTTTDEVLNKIGS